jgi:3,4-dihydroxy-2-butanone 4-phosphate synthase
MMVPNNEDRLRTAYTVTVDYKHGAYPSKPDDLRRLDIMFRSGTTTGISAHDRALTAQALASPSALPSDFTRPGHMVPLRAREGGVLTRKGHTESAVDLCMLTHLPQAGLLCELVNDDAEGTMARRDDCRAFADRWGLRMISVEMLAEWRRSEGL